MDSLSGFSFYIPSIPLLSHRVNTSSKEGPSLAEIRTEWKTWRRSVLVKEAGGPIVKREHARFLLSFVATIPNFSPRTRASFRFKFFDRETSRFPNSAWDRYETRNNEWKGREEREREREIRVENHIFVRSRMNALGFERNDSFFLSQLQENSHERNKFERTILLFFSSRFARWLLFFFFLRNYRRENQWYFRVLYLFRENGNVRGKSVIRHWSVNRSFIDCDVVRRVGGR